MVLLLLAGSWSTTSLEEGEALVSSGAVTLAVAQTQVDGWQRAGGNTCVATAPVQRGVCLKQLTREELDICSKGPRDAQETGRLPRPGQGGDALWPQLGGGGRQAQGSSLGPMRYTERDF